MKTIKTFIFLFLLFKFSDSFGQSIMIRGTVIDSASGSPMQQVSVFQRESDAGALTDKDGNYSFRINKTGVIHFTYIGYKEQVRAVDFFSGDLVINAVMPVLPFNTRELQITAAKMNKLDSLNNREDNKGVFQPVRKSPVSSQMNADDNYRTGLVISPFAAYRKLFSKDAKRQKAYRTTLLQKEKDDYIDGRFSKNIVVRITGLNAPRLDTFMVKFRPEYELLIQTTDYELYDYIKRSGQAFTNKVVDSVPAKKSRKKKPKNT